MDRELLERMLAEGRSLEQIGRAVGKDPSTVSYWLRKHGLQAAHRDRHLAKGGLPLDALRSMLEGGSTYAEIAAEFGVSVATVRYWLTRLGIRSTRGPGARRVHPRAEAGAGAVRSYCATHGMTRFRPDRRGSLRCARCQSDAVAARRRRIKAILVEEAGGSCRLCGYSRYAGALQFHHLDPHEKRFALSVGGLTRSLEKAREESRKCVLLCSNCHAEVEAGVASLG
ncbi:MAG TPA: helix-turn-helix domain-containing protein [Thermoleophilaceae bacterium]|jgi:DNA-binding transcriptional ArsR family regulator